jgi:hypothetical protein
LLAGSEQCTKELIIVKEKKCFDLATVCSSENSPSFFFFKMADGLNGVSFLLAPIVLIEKGFDLATLCFFFFLQEFFFVCPATPYQIFFFFFFICEKGFFFFLKDRNVFDRLYLMAARHHSLNTIRLCKEKK